MAMVGNVGFVAHLSAPGVTQGVDIETMFMALGFERSEIMDKVIAGHAEDMKKRNDEIAKLNNVLQSVRAQSAAGKGFKMDADSPEFQELSRQGVALPKDPQKKLDEFNSNLAKDREALKLLEEKYGVKLDPGNPKHAKIIERLAGGGLSAMSAAADLHKLVPAGQRKQFEKDFGGKDFPQFGGAVTGKGKEIKFSKEEAQALIENIKTQIDNLSSNSQLDMIKLQGLINKRNQTIEMMTNLMQKFQQTNNSIVGNMR
jgi:hypothetical protein